MKRLVWLDQVRGGGVPDGGGGGCQERRVPEGTHPWQMRPKRFLANENMAVLWEEVGSG